MSTIQSNLRGVLATLRNAGVFDSIQAVDDDIWVSRGQWNIRYWVSINDNEVRWRATNANESHIICNSYVCRDYKTLLVEILNSMVGHFPAHEVDTPETKAQETPAREVLAGDMDKSYIGRTVTMPWTFRGHEATITGVLESVKHDACGTYFEMENTGNQRHDYVFRCVSDSTVTIHDNTEESDQ